MSGSGSKEEPLTVAGCRFWQFPTFADQRGYLTVADFATMSFPVRRVFYISQVPEGQTRANHAQRESKELLLAITGTVSVLIDDGRNRQSIVLWRRNVGLLIAPKTWCSLSHFSKDAVLAVFASHPYDVADQVADYDEFLSIAVGNSQRL
jgi:dTDP-4-dehydrorhamnose 3,5-epimerase-like enzyme